MPQRRKTVKIHIENRQKTHEIERAILETAAQRILSVLGCPDGELSVVIVDDPQIRELNRQYLDRDRPTNVISFPMQEGEGAGLQPDILGDVVISADTAARDADEAGQPMIGEILFLLLHGILHLCGFDHERGSETEARRMEEKEREIFARLRQDLLPETV